MLGAGLAAGRATPQVSLELLRRLAELPAREAEEALDVFRNALERGFIVDTGAGSSLMNRVLMRLRMGAPWELVKYEVMPPRAVTIARAATMPWKSSGEVSCRTRITSSPPRRCSSATR